MMYEKISYETNGPVATVTLKSAETYNAMSRIMRQELDQVTSQIDKDPAIRIAIIKGEGRGFSAGMDLSEGVPDPVSDLLLNEYKPFFDRIYKSNKLYIAQVHGACAGVAAALVMTCDFVTMEQNSAINMAFARIALIPDGGCTHYLFQALGYRRALEAIVEGQNLSADFCYAHGLANKVLPTETLEQETFDWALRLAKRAPLAVAASKRLLHQLENDGFQQAFDAEAKEQTILTRSEDSKNAVAAFLNKQTAEFQGR